MKLLLLIGDSAVGKMTVGQELTKITSFSLFHNHQTIELVLDVFKEYRQETIDRLRKVIFEDFATSDHFGLIFTAQMAFDQKEDWSYLQEVMDIFKVDKHTVYFVELVADLETKMARNASENRLLHKPSKRDLQFSEHLNRQARSRYRVESFEGEVPFKRYLKIDNSQISAQEVAQQIKKAFDF